MLDDSHRGHHADAHPSLLGSAIVSGRVVVDGERIGYFYREAPEGDRDSGWRFMVGNESDAYLNGPSGAHLSCLHCIVEREPEIAGLLRAPVGAAFVRDSITGRWKVDPDGPPEAR